MKDSKVTLVSVDTGVIRTATTNDEGNYEFLNVRIGRYTVSGEVEGFKKASSDSFQLTVGARQRVDLTLQVWATFESVTVTGAATALETETSSRGTVIGSA